jgi:hypothetical protein
MTVTVKKLESYERDRDNFVIIKTCKGFNVTNLRTHKLYKVTESNGQTNCNCPDFLYRGKDKGEACKHLIAVKKLRDRKKWR